MTSRATSATDAALPKTQRDWYALYSSRLVITDLLVLVWVVVGVQLAWLGFDSADANFRGNLSQLGLNYTAISVVIVGAWMAVLAIFGTRGSRVLGTGSDEYKLIANASVRLFGLVAIVSYLLKLDLARGYVLIAFPFGLAMLVASRWIWRVWLRAQRDLGRYSSQVLLVGSESSVTHIARELVKQPAAGYRVVGACIPTDRIGGHLGGTSIPVCGTLDNVIQALAATRADTVIVTSADELSPTRMRELSWSLEPGNQHLIVAPSLTDVSGPRIHTRPVAGLPLIHVETPRFDGRKNFAKRAFDIVASLGLVVVLSPVMGAIALGIKLTSPGPVLFYQDRVGMGGTAFKMFKFRSMVTNAESLLDELRAQDRDAGNAMLFKMKNDPRITPIGKFLRRFSLDELPQLFCVLLGTMSLVGPRPPLQSEVSRYDQHVHRRFLVKPGITGLWQVSGRSNLTWEESVRLDLFYVENWSITGDVVILWRTFKAVVNRDGAY
ncbi:sugar transferase [Marisediminicola senii]|uniref:sugar transferase n=1 Tax=Marisediminicola senii TaxID=2711233 RepID=UPI0013EC4DCC|nr:sugar transferase [Marisediminicola senii]